MKKKLTVTLTKEEVINLSRLVYQDLRSIKEQEKMGYSINIEDKLAKKFGNKFLPKLLNFLDLKQPQEAA